MTIYAKITSTGSYLPEKVLSNEDLEKMVDTSDEWIKKRTGISSRHIIADTGETSFDMGLAAAKQAIDESGIEPSAIDLIIFATSTPDSYMPSSACLVQKALGIENCPAFDLNAACSGFVYSMSVANQFIQSGTAQHVLIIGCDAMSRIIDWTDRATCVLFGDGAGAMVLSASDKPGILGAHLHADGKHADLLYVDNQIFDRSKVPHLQMQGRALYRKAVEALGNVVEETLLMHGLNRSDIDWLVPHQANLRIIAATAEKLGMSMDQVVQTVGEHANTSAASIPLAFDFAVRSGKVQRGQTVLLEAFGAGLTWGAVLAIY